MSIYKWSILPLVINALFTGVIFGLSIYLWIDMSLNRSSLPMVFWLGVIVVPLACLSFGWSMRREYYSAKAVLTESAEDWENAKALIRLMASQEALNKALSHPASLYASACNAETRFYARRAAGEVPEDSPEEHLFRAEVLRTKRDFWRLLEFVKKLRDAGVIKPVVIREKFGDYLEKPTVADRSSG